jgi:hypothetical protein
MFSRNTALAILSVLISISLVAAWGMMLAQAAPIASTSPEVQPILTSGQEPLTPDAGRRLPSGGDFSISGIVNNKAYLAIAFNTGDHQYLVVWSQITDSDMPDLDIWGQRYSDAGVPLGTSFPISTHTKDQDHASVAYNSVRNEYLVVWTDYRSGQDIYGQRVGADGSLLGNPDPTVNFEIASGSDEHLSPDLAYNPAADEYLVVWEDWRNSLTTEGDIFGQRVDGDGSLLGNPDPSVNFAICTANTFQEAPSVAYNSAQDEYGVVWDDHRNATSIDIYGQRVDADGSLISGNVTASLDDPVAHELKPDLIYRTNPADPNWPYTLVFLYENDPDVFVEKVQLNIEMDAMNRGEVLTDTADRWGSLSACYDPASGQVLVAWADTRNSTNTEDPENDIYAARIDRDGHVATPGSFAITTASGGQYDPVAGCSSSSHQYLVVYEDDRDMSSQKLYGQRVWWGGQLVGPEFIVGVDALAAFDPTVAFDERENRFLVVWYDDLNGDIDIYGQLYYRDGLPIENNFVIYQGSGAQVHPDVAYNSTSRSYLAVWEDQQNKSVRGQLVSTQGSLSYDPVIISSAAVTATHPTVASNPAAAYNDFLVVFEQNGGTASGQDIGARIVKANNSLSPNGVVVSSLPDYQGLPDVVYNPDVTDGEYLVVFQDKSSGVYQITGQKMGPALLILGAKIAVSTGGVAEQAPAAVYNPDDDQYLVVWHRDTSTQGEDIYAQLLDSNGTPSGDNFLVNKVSNVSDQMFPATIYFAALNRYAVIWQDNRDGVTQWDLRGQWLSHTGAVLGPFDLMIFRDYGVQANPAIVYAPGYNQVLTVWYDNSLPDIYSVHGRFSTLDTTPPIARFTRDEIWGYAGDTFAFNAWPSFDREIQRSNLLVRWDLNNDGNWEIPLGHDKYITRTIATPGIYTITLEVWNLAWLTDTISLPIFVRPTPPLMLEPDQLDSPSASLVVTPTLATAGSTFTFDGRASSGTPTVRGRWNYDNSGMFDTGWSTILTSTHVYTEAGDYTARLELYDGSETSNSALVQLTVLPAAFTSLEATPSQLWVTPHEAVKLRSSANDVYGNEVFDPSGVVWTLLQPLAGTLDPSGIFTASLKAGTYPDAIRASLGGIEDKITVTVFYPFKVYLPVILK